VLSAIICFWLQVAEVVFDKLQNRQNTGGLRQYGGTTFVSDPQSHPNHRPFLLVLIFACTLALSSCGSVPDRHPYLTDANALGTIGSFGDIRFWGDSAPADFMDRIKTMTSQQAEALQPGLYGTEHDYLAISGGGQNGAFAAGLLVGWTKLGTRPEFEMVTGISTGALMAPFVFLGPQYDHVLREIFGSYSTKDIMKKRSRIKGMTGDAMASSAPLRELLERYLTPAIIDQLATQHRIGRRLFISTTNLDAQRPVIWNLTAIAATGLPEARQLIIDVILASASLPAALPPVFFEVEVDGQIYDELHVDGGVTSQVFVYPAAVDWKLVTQQLKVKGTPQVWVIRNSKLNPHFEPIKGSLMSIAGSSVDSLIRTQGIGDLYQIYTNALRDELEFNLAFIPPDFDVESDEYFDAQYMRALFDYAYRMTTEGYEWHRSPPAPGNNPFWDKTDP
jgi:predicted acylesterase/phospholipase RssA